MKQIEEDRDLQWFERLNTRLDSDDYLIIEYQDLHNNLDAVKVDNSLREYIGDFQFSELVRNIKQVLCEQIIKKDRK